MRGKLILLTILVFLFLGFAGGKYFILDRQNVDGTLKVISSPPASVFINNVASGNTPFEGQIKSGDYTLKLIPLGEATSSASWQGRVPVYKNSLTYVNRELGVSETQSAGEIFTVRRMEKRPANPNYGEVSVDTEPAGALVYLDTDEKGVASVLLSDVTKGSHEISVYLPGFKRRTQKIQVEAGYRVRAQFKLAIDPNRNLRVQPSGRAQKKTFVTIKDTPTGFLRVRTEPSFDASEAAQLEPGVRVEVLEEKSDWYHIKYKEKESGWVAAEFAIKEASESAQ